MGKPKSSSKKQPKHGIDFKDDKLCCLSVLSYMVHTDLKSDNLLISADKSIKIADFGVARIEVQTEGMTPETGTYRWMAPNGSHASFDHIHGAAIRITGNGNGSGNPIHGST
ncbi:hypothetical protein AgCh_013174 [Apium graveolens]